LPPRRRGGWGGGGLGRLTISAITYEKWYKKKNGIRTAKGKALIWRDYKAVSFHQLGVAAFFQDNSA